MRRTWGEKRKNIPKSKRSELTKRRSVGKADDVGVKDRKTKQVRARVVSTTDADTLQGFVKETVKDGSKVYTGDTKRYAGATPERDARALLRRPTISRRVVRNGAPTNELVLSASTERNERAFQQILILYIAPGSTVADVTYGKGVFWRHVPSGLYDVRATDIQDGADCRDLPYEDGEIDCVVFDPPYMHSPGGTAHTGHTPFEDHYRNNGSGSQTESKYHQAVLDLYEEGGVEAYRVLRDNGVVIVK